MLANNSESEANQTSPVSPTSPQPTQLAVRRLYQRNGSQFTAIQENEEDSGLEEKITGPMGRARRTFNPSSPVLTMGELVGYYI